MPGEGRFVFCAADRNIPLPLMNDFAVRNCSWVLIPAIKQAVNEPESKAKIEKMGFLVDYGTPQELEKLVPKQYKELKAILDEVSDKDK